jgi:hypothetical protein
VEGQFQEICKVYADSGKHCRQKATKKFTTLYCQKCDVGLRVGECFEKYHSELNYLE